MFTIPKTTFVNLDKDKKQRIIEAALNEFSLRSYEISSISNIIKECSISRGSFYQYFEDKVDLYLFIFDYIKDKKIEFLSDELKNSSDLSFLEVFRSLYKQGIEFAYAYPRFTLIGKHVFSLKGELYDKLIGNGLKLAKTYYITYIEADKQKGIIRKDVDSEVVANMVIQLTNNITIEGFLENEIDLNKLLIKVDNLIDIFKKGIEGDQNV